jgi:hypothetical protein
MNDSSEICEAAVDWKPQINIVSDASRGAATITQSSFDRGIEDVSTIEVPYECLRDLAEAIIRFAERVGA